LAELWPFNKKGGVFVCVARYTKANVLTTSQKLLVQFHPNFTGLERGAYVLFDISCFLLANHTPFFMEWNEHVTLKVSMMTTI
jgi:hypothetical protein